MSGVLESARGRGGRFGVRLVLNGQPVVDATTYAAVVFMVVATTMATPPLLIRAITKTAD